jgi:hypothetical protein
MSTAPAFKSASVFATDKEPAAEDLSRQYHGKSSRWHYEAVQFEDLVIDPRIQRGEETAEINRMAPLWNEAAIGTLTLSERILPDGQRELVVLDGQQRRATGLKVGHKNKVQAIVHEGLTVAEEAELFLLLNTRQSVNSWTQFRIARTAGDPLAQAVGVILDELHIPLGSPKGFSAVVMARRVAKRQGGLVQLHWALRQVQKIFDPLGEGGIYDGRVVEAFAMIYRHCSEQGIKIDEDNLHKKLVRHGAGSVGLTDLIGHGHTLQKLDRVKIAKSIAHAIAARYNLGKPAGSVHAMPMVP